MRWGGRVNNHRGSAQSERGMALLLEEIRIRNFKSLRDARVELGKLNVLIGPNQSGKSNFVQALRLLRDLTDPGIVNPFARHWGYGNVVWNHDEALNITYGLRFSGGLRYEVELTGAGGRLSVLREHLERDDEVSVERLGSDIRGIRAKPMDIIDRYTLINDVVVLSLVKDKDLIGLEAETPALSMICDVNRFVRAIVVVHPNPHRAREPAPLKGPWTLEYDAGNLHAFLWHNFGRAAVSEEMLDVLQLLFPDIEAIWLEETTDKRVHLVVQESGVKHPSESISDGFYKILAILATLELKPSLLVVEEIENSIYPEAMEVLIDVLRRSEAQVVLTTHSPVVLDLVEPEEVILVYKEAGETKLARLREPERIKAKLEELGLGLGQSWLYGGLAP